MSTGMIVFILLLFGLLALVDGVRIIVKKESRGIDQKDVVASPWRKRLITGREAQSHGIQFIVIGLFLIASAIAIYFIGQYLFKFF
jgi:hypothetical protein